MSRLTLVGCHFPPRGVLISLRFNSRATPRALVMPPARISSTYRTRSAALAWACCFTALTAASFPRPRRCAAPFGLPSLWLLLLAAWSAALVRALICSRSCWALIAYRTSFLYGKRGVDRVSFG